MAELCGTPQWNTDASSSLDTFEVGPLTVREAPTTPTPISHTIIDKDKLSDSFSTSDLLAICASYERVLGDNKDTAAADSHLCVLNLKMDPFMHDELHVYMISHVPAFSSFFHICTTIVPG